MRNNIDIKSELTTHYVLFSVEGTAEGVIIDKLVGAEALLVPTNRIVKDRMTFKPFTRQRKAKSIAEQYLNENYQTESATELLIARIIDSSTPSFSLPRQYKNAAIVRNFVTSPEIEMLAIYKENACDLWKRRSRTNRQLKPCEFCKQDLKLPDIKSATFLNEYWNDPFEIIRCIKRYSQDHSNRDSNSFLLADLLA